MWEGEGIAIANRKVVVMIQCILYILGTANTGSSNCVLQDFTELSSALITFFTHYCKKKRQHILARSQVHMNADTERMRKKKALISHKMMSFYLNGVLCSALFAYYTVLKIKKRTLRLAAVPI